MKKALFLVVSMALIASMFLACKGKDQQAAASGGAQSPADPNLNLTSYPINKNNYRGYDFGLFTDNWENPPYAQATKLIEDETGIKVSYTSWSSSSANERASILLNTGAYPELMGGWTFGRGDVIKMAADGVLLPLEDLIDKYTVYLKETLNLPGIRESITHADGHVYTFPYIVNEPTVYFVPWINQKYLEDVGMAMPTTTEEFKQVLIAFRDKIKAPNGQSIIPFSGDPLNKNLAQLAAYFGLPSGRSYKHDGYMAILNGQLDFTANKPQYKEWITWMADLYANKLIDPEIFTQTPDMFGARSKQDLYGVAISYEPTHKYEDSDPRSKEYWRTDYRPLPVLKAPGVSNPVYPRINYGEPDKGVQNYSTQLVMTDKAKGKEIAVIRWIDWLYNPDNIVRVQNGPLDYPFPDVRTTPTLPAKYTKLDDGIPFHYQRVDETQWPESQKKLYDYMWYGALPHYSSKIIWEDAPGTPATWKDMLDMNTLYEPYLETQLIPVTFAVSDADRQKMADIQTPIVEYVDQKMAEWISGQANVDAEWDAYLSQLNRLGLEELIQIRKKMANM
ncbi:MAG: extracellular solute-binding protein [Treponema sp.]|jgi:putative aldouronate transport system substrate-binding protein|nr:extracellular solute-binding protein [Treponema sp.]